MKIMLPHSYKAEQYVLGSIFKSPNLYSELREIVSDVFFYNPNHQIIFLRIMECECYEDINIYNIYKNTSYDEGIELGYLKYLRYFCHTTPSNAKVYANIVKEKYLLREIVGICESVNNQYDSNELNLSENQKDKICFIIGEWYLEWKEKLVNYDNRTHQLGLAKEKLKLLLCGEN